MKRTTMVRPSTSGPAVQTESRERADQAPAEAAREHDAQRTDGCTVWPGLCTDTEPGHYDHYAHDHRITDKSGNSLLDVTFVQFGDKELGDSPASVGIGGQVSEDYAPEEFHQAANAVRRLMDTGDDMAVQVMTRTGNGRQALAILDQRIDDDIERLTQLLAARRRLAIQLNPGTTPFAETDEEQVAAAAFELATRSGVAALDLSPDAAGTVRALRGWLSLAEDENRA
ncbi:hypothetical protein [Streptomyces sp. NPDC048385]|uniref:hypothetical protein n=1 Tax=unclassified Streptomyces TaxID=2593676 RepID=UPI00343CF3AF